MWGSAATEPPGGGFGRGVPPPAENFAILGTENHVLMQECQNPRKSADPRRNLMPAFSSVHYSQSLLCPYEELAWITAAMIWCPKINKSKMFKIFRAQGTDLLPSFLYHSVNEELAGMPLGLLKKVGKYRGIGGLGAQATAFSQSELPRKPPIDTHGRYTYNTCNNKKKKSERRKKSEFWQKSEKRHPWTREREREKKEGVLILYLGT